MSTPHDLVIANRAHEARIHVLIEVRYEAQHVVRLARPIGPDTVVAVEHGHPDVG